MKFCRGCQAEKDETEFYPCKGKKSGLQSRCKICCNAANNRNYQKNAEAICERTNAYTKANREKYREYSKVYYYKHYEKERERRSIYSKENRKMLSQKHKERYHSNIQYRLAHLLRQRVSDMLKLGEGKRAGSAVRDLGCSVEEFKSYIESLWQPGMSWENWGPRGWHIDHKLQLAMFDLSNRDQFLIACNYKNLQPLWAHENQTKNKKRSP